ncbi:MAG: hypothetical protein IPL78_11270 [Chloroflexi bacterium]|nr:hypothetical protein [Chloroflexota bacterium]
MMQTTFARIHKVLATVIGLATWGQLFLAGLWHAEVLSTPQAHVFLGLGILLASLLTLICAVAGQMEKRTIKLTAFLFFLILLQPILIRQREGGIAFLSAFHTLNAAFIGMTSGMVMAVSPVSVATGD